MTHSQAMKTLGALWKQMSSEEKEPYYNLNEKERDRFSRQKGQYDTQGYFITTEGRPSKANEKKKQRAESKVDNYKDSSSKTSSLEEPYDYTIQEIEDDTSFIRLASGEMLLLDDDEGETPIEF